MVFSPCYLLFSCFIFISFLVCFVLSVCLLSLFPSEGLWWMSGVLELGGVLFLCFIRETGREVKKKKTEKELFSNCESPNANTA